MRLISKEQAAALVETDSATVDNRESRLPALDKVRELHELQNVEKLKKGHRYITPGSWYERKFQKDLIEDNWDYLFGKQKLIKTFWREIDSFYSRGHGISYPSITAIGAKPGAGKTIFIQCLGEQIAKYNKTIVVHMDREMSLFEHMHRKVCREGKLDSTELRISAHKGLGERDKIEFDGAISRLSSNWNLIVDKDPPNSKDPIGDLDRKLGALRQDFPDEPITLIIDSIQRSVPYRGGERRSEVEAWIEGIYDLTIDKYGLCTFLISELARGSGKKYIPTIRSFKETGAVEYRADNVWVFTEEKEDDEEGPYILQTLKARSSASSLGPIAKYIKVRPHYGMQEISMRPAKQQEIEEQERKEAEEAKDGELSPKEVREFLALSKRALTQKPNLE